MSSIGSDAPVDFGRMLTTSHASRQSGSLDAVDVALASNSVQVATEAMHRQYDRFLEVFA
jgi:hypothetical protein